MCSRSDDDVSLHTAIYGYTDTELQQVSAINSPADMMTSTKQHKHYSLHVVYNNSVLRTFHNPSLGQISLHRCSKEILLTMHYWQIFISLVVSMYQQSSASQFVLLIKDGQCWCIEQVVVVNVEEGKATTVTQLWPHTDDARLGDSGRLLPRWPQPLVLYINTGHLLSEAQTDLQMTVGTSLHLCNRIS